jgi:nucleoside-diphosphate-sugar epimerase
MYLITGGAGFIGSHIVHRLVELGEGVRILDDFSSGRRENLAGIEDRVTVIDADIQNLEAIRPHFTGVRHVVHLAALSSVVFSMENPVAANAVNIGGTLNVLVAARDAGAKRLVFAASAAAYGDSPVLPRTESQAPRPLSPYALTKVTGENYCQIFTALFGLDAVALRFFNIFGPRQNPDSPYTGVLSKFIKAYIEGRSPVIYGDGGQSRDFTYVDNVVQAVLLACEAQNAGGKVINVGVGRSFTLNQTISLLNEIFGYEARPSYDSSRPGDVRESVADITMARQILRYEPAINFEEGLRRTVDWYRAASLK